MAFQLFCLELRCTLISIIGQHIEDQHKKWRKALYPRHERRGGTPFLDKASFVKLLASGTALQFESVQLAQVDIDPANPFFYLNFMTTAFFTLVVLDERGSPHCLPAFCPLDLRAGMC